MALTVAQAVAAWLAVPGAHRGPAEQAHARRIGTALGNLWLDDLTDQAVAAYLARLAGEGLAPATVRNVRTGGHPDVVEVPLRGRR